MRETPEDRAPYQSRVSPAPSDDVKPYTRVQLDTVAVLIEEEHGNLAYSVARRLLATARAGLADTARVDGLQRLATKVESVEIVDNVNGGDGFSLYGMGAPEEPSTGMTLRDAIDDELRAEAEGIAFANSVMKRSGADNA